MTHQRQTIYDWDRSLAPQSIGFFKRGMTIGYHGSLPGGWGERMIAHESQLYPIDDAMSDHTAVLMEPLAVGMHAALRSRPFGDGPALVIGSGPIALGMTWALRAAGYSGDGPPPDLPAEVLADTSTRYVEFFERLTGSSLAEYRIPLFGDDR